MIQSDSKTRRQIARYCRLMYEKGWVSYHDGNLTARLGNGRFMSTPTAMSKGDVTPEAIIVVDAKGRTVSGRLRPFGELPLHLAVYSCRPEVNCVVHAHPPYASGFAVAGLTFDAAVTAEFTVALGERIPLVPFNPVKSPAMAVEIGKAATVCNAMLLANHGALAFGETVEQAFLRMELLEHHARINLIAGLLGGAKSLPAGIVQSLAEDRRKAGLQPGIPGEAKSRRERER